MSTDSQRNTSQYFFAEEYVARLVVLHTYLTEAMGGTLAEREDVERMGQILDLGCGVGGWVLDVASAFPQIQVTGVDINANLIASARALAQSQQQSNVSFQVMDITKPLAFADASFDLVNGRLIAFHTPEGWASLLQECKRILRPGGILRLTESDAGGCTSLALEALWGHFYRAVHAVGQNFSPTGRTLGIVPVLSRLLREAGFTNIASRPYIFDYSAGEPAYPFRQSAGEFFTQLVPFLVSVNETTQEEAEALLQQMKQEVESSDFCGIMYFRTVWGEKA